MARLLLQNTGMRGIRAWSLVGVCLIAAACSSTSSSSDAGQGGGGASGQGGHQGTGGNGAGGNGQGGSGQGGASADGGNGTGGHASDAGRDSMTSPTGCNPACGTGSVCIGTGTEGGAVFFPDGGVCPPGRHVANGVCVQDLTFTCVPIPTGCNGTATCACAPSQCNGRVCRVPTAGELDCVLQVP